MTEVALIEAQPGDIVHRVFGGMEDKPMKLKITKVYEGLIFCGPWTFDQETGVEEDPELGWGRACGITGTYLTKVERP